MAYKVLIVNSNREYNRFLSSNGYDLIDIGDFAYAEEVISKIDLVMFTGGADIHPVFYKGVHNGTSYVDKQRDDTELGLFNICLKHNIKMAGICRGIQFLNVMCGGRMYQDIDMHGGVLHEVIFPTLNEVVTVSSTHHQLVILPNNAFPVAWTYPHNRANKYIGPEATQQPSPVHEIEAAVYPKYNAFGVQFHPEMRWCPNEGKHYYLKILSDFMDMGIEEFIDKYAYIGDNDVEKRRPKTTGR